MYTIAIIKSRLHGKLGRGKVIHDCTVLDYDNWESEVGRSCRKMRPERDQDCATVRLHLQAELHLHYTRLHWLPQHP